LQKKRILLIGGAGTLGSDILDAQLPDYELFVIDNFSESALAEDEIQGKVSYRNMSVADGDGLIKVFQEFRPEVVLYLATTLSKDQLCAYESNVLGMANTVKAAERTGKPYLIYIQSFLTRDCESTITVESPVEAKDSYSTWKLAAEYLLNTYSGSHTTLVLASVLSPRLSVGAIPAFIKRIQSNELIKVTETFRDYIQSRNFLTALTKLIGVEGKPRIAVLGSQSPISTEEILKKTALSLRRDLSLVKYEIIQPNASDPKSILIKDSIGCSINLIEDPIELSINKIAINFLESNKLVRTHHYGVSCHILL